MSNKKLPMLINNKTILWLVSIILYFIPQQNNAFFLDGNGFYSISGQTQTNPGGATNLGTYQAILQNFNLMTEIKATDQFSIFLNLKLFDNPRTSFLGDIPKSQECVTNTSNNEGTNQNCENHYQSTQYPGYEPLTPKITQAYVRYALDYCILEIGRRARHWGNGIFLNKGDQPFDKSASIFDGINCHMNLQKIQTISINIGYDKLAETSTTIEVGLPQSTINITDGSTKKSSDINQFFASIEYDDTKASPQSSFNRKVGIYISNIIASPITQDGTTIKTDVKFLDIYLALFFSRFTFSNELLLRLGKSADPTWKKYGGLSVQNGESYRNDLSSIGFAGYLEFTLTQTGIFLGPKEYNEGTYKAHILSLDYAYALGDSDGYYEEYNEIQKNIYKTYEPQRDTKAQALALHQNYKPALIMFNAHPILDHLNTDGIFDPIRVMNTTLFGLGYRYEDLNIGNFEIKLIHAFLNNTIPSTLKEQIEQEQQLTTKPIGYYGNSLGYEIDFKYKKNFGKNLSLGVASGALLPGKAWQTSTKTPDLSVLVELNTVFKF